MSITDESGILRVTYGAGVTIDNDGALWVRRLVIYTFRGTVRGVGYDIPGGVRYVYIKHKFPMIKIYPK